MYFSDSKCGIFESFAGRLCEVNDNVDRWKVLWENLYKGIFVERIKASCILKPSKVFVHHLDRAGHLCAIVLG